MTKTVDIAEICIEQCGGLCCDPWWGIITYQVKKDKGLSDLGDFRAELVAGLKEREARIVSTYVTTEKLSRPLFDKPSRYSFIVQGVQKSGGAYVMDLIAMFAFKCRFLSPDSRFCTIHPTHIGGQEIRPVHCASLGSAQFKPGEKWHCRILYAARTDPKADAVKKMLELEQSTTQLYYKGGFVTPELAAEKVIERLTEYAAENEPKAQNAAAKEVPGRNDPCPCGSGRKFKKCHGA